MVADNRPSREAFASDPPAKKYLPEWQVGLLICFAVPILLIGAIHSAMAVTWLAKCPYDSDGGLHVQWFTSAIPCALFLLTLTFAIIVSVVTVVRRAAANLPFLNLRQVDGTGIGLSVSPILLIHPLVLLLGIAAILSAFVGELGTGLHGLSGNPCRFVTSDDGMAGRASRMGHIDASGIGDRGIVDLADHGRHMEWLRVYESPAITSEGLAPFTNLRSLTIIEFRIHGTEQAKWGDLEATRLTQSPKLRDLRLEGFGGLTDAWLDGLLERCPELTSAYFSESPGLSEASRTRFHEALRARDEAKYPR